MLALLLVGCSTAAAQVWDRQLCQDRESHWSHSSHGYIYSGQSSLLQQEEKVATVTGAGGANLTAVTRDWARAGDWCQ